MNSTLVFDFIVDRATNTVTVNREFAAEQSLVWDAFTKKEILDQWWAPKPWKSRTKSMDFTVGGRRFYAMVSPEGQEHWSVQQFTAITPKTNFKMHSVFTDAEERVNDAMPQSNWDLSFSERNGSTTVAILIRMNTLAELEQHIQMGFKEGFTMTLNYLEGLLQNLQ
ncbi:MAG TPA: SRPBCC domain-containing protein [Puia sp.]|nr:SRPBCC domain-containing protein [Puia sp.]